MNEFIEQLFKVLFAFGSLFGIGSFVGYICLRIELTELQRQLSSFLNRKGTQK